MRVGKELMCKNYEHRCRKRYLVSRKLTPGTAPLSLLLKKADKCGQVEIISIALSITLTR